MGSKSRVNLKQGQIIKRNAGVDPITLAVFMSKLQSITQEMGIIMTRSSWSPTLTEAGDYVCAILNWDNKLIAMAEQNAQLTMATPFAVRTTAEFFGDEVYPGDVMIHNDPYPGGNHIADWTVLCPVFFEEELVGWAATKAHQIDTGGTAPGAYYPDATDIFQEGLIMPPIKIYERGKIRRDVFNLIVKNVRLQKDQRGDLHAMIGSVKLCERRIQELIKKYGLETYKATVNNILASSERRMRAALDKIPDGTYDGDAEIEFIWAGKSKTLTIRTAITIKGNGMIVDFTGSDAQIENYINSPLVNTYSGVYAALLTSIDPDIPQNDGCFVPVKIVAPRGTIVNPEWPAPAAMATIVPAGAIMEACWRALSKVIPENVSSAWYKICVPISYSIDPRNGEFNTCVHYMQEGGAGTVWGRDGQPACGSSGPLAAHDWPVVETNEVVYPLLTLVCELPQDSGGSGRWRGGLGVRYSFKAWPPHPSTVVHLMFNSQIPVRGILGAGNGVTNEAWRIKLNGERTFLTGGQYQFGPEDVYLGISQGGAGVGSPLERDVDLVRRDVLDEYVSLESSKKDYGVVINPETLEVDYEATRELRVAIKEK
ncbi:hydantoinase B/oxoprolinase family protein [Chloroflexota bacterium]